MISMYAEYSGRTLYVALSSDTIDGAKNGDTLYEMDTGKRYVYNETSDSWDEQPKEGGPVLQTWQVTVNTGSAAYAARIYSILNDEKTAISRYKSLTKNTSTEYYIPAVASTAQLGGYVIQLMAGHSVSSLVNATEVAVDPNNNNIHYIRVTADNAVINLP